MWQKKVPTKLFFLACEVVWVWVLTINNLRRQGKIMVNQCFLCKGEEETVNHLLLHCDGVGGFG